MNISVQKWLDAFSIIEDFWLSKEFWARWLSFFHCPEDLRSSEGSRELFEAIGSLFYVRDLILPWNRDRLTPQLEIPLRHRAGRIELQVR